MLEFDGLHKSFGDNHVLDGVGFTVAPGSMFGFCGSNGAGKTTTMRIAHGPGPGRRRRGPLAGPPARRGGPPPDRLHAGGARALPEDEGRRAGHLLRPAARPGRRRGGAGHRGVGRTASGLGERRGDPVEKLSLGNQQRVQLAAALVSRPEVLILDEPFSGLDPVGVDSLAEALLEQCRRGVPVVFSSHQLDLVERLCDSVGILARGRMVATGTVEELRRREAGRLLRVVVPDAAPAGPPRCPASASSPSRRGDTLLELAAGTDDQAVLAAALRTGRVTHFAWRRADAGRAVPRGRRRADRGGGGVTEPRARRAAPRWSGWSPAGRSRPASATRTSSSARS